MPRIVKRCGCGIEYTTQTWLVLRRVGVQEIRKRSIRGSRVVQVLELRNCGCGSTIARWVRAPEYEQQLAA